MYMKYWKVLSTNGQPRKTVLGNVLMSCRTMYQRRHMAQASELMLTATTIHTTLAGGVRAYNATTVRQLRMQWCSAWMCQNRTILGDELMTFQKQLWIPLKTLPSKAWSAASRWADTDILLLCLLWMLPGFGLNIHKHLVNRERRKSCHQLGGGCQFSWYGTHYIYAHKYGSAENSNLNLNLILKIQKKINSERRFTQVSLLLFSLKQNLKKQSELVSIIIPC